MESEKNNSIDANIKVEAEESQNEVLENHKETQEESTQIMLEVYSEILDFCKKDGKSVPQLLNELKTKREADRISYLTDKCGGDSELALHILSLENGTEAQKDELFEIRKFFPKITSAEQLPSTVVNKSKARGTLILDEYLRYLLEEDMRAKASAKEQQISARASTGSLTNRKSEINPEAAEFLRGLWK